MFLRFAPAIGLFAALAPAAMPVLAHAQTNIDQGKTPAQIFAEDCAACHKTTRGLAAGKNSLSLGIFLREHYTASRAQAAALAAYVLGAGGAEPAKPGQKPGQERAKNEEPKPGVTRPGRPPAKPETPASARLKPVPAEEAKPEQQASHPPAGEHEAHPVTATRGRKTEPETPAAAPPPAAVVSVPPASETPAVDGPKEAPKTEPKIETGSAPRAEPGQDQTPTTSAAAPAESQSGEDAPVPRDNIPD